MLRTCFICARKSSSVNSLPADLALEVRGLVLAEFVLRLLDHDMTSPIPRIRPAIRFRGGSVELVELLAVEAR